jgi:Rps23 Pro-64 3,4-dihydroxylase Tpa1-like proline 4-hydroxylase
VKVNLLSPDIYEIEDFVSLDEQTAILDYCKSLDESEWWKSEDFGWTDSDSEQYKKGFFYGKQKLGPKPKEFDSINANLENLFSDLHYIDKLSLQRHPSGNFMEPHRDYWNKEADTHVRYGVVVYFNDEYEGGAIKYPDINLVHKPKARSLILHGGNILHGTTKVTSNDYRYFSTSFVRGTVDKPVILNQELFGDVEQSDGSNYP